MKKYLLLTGMLGMSLMLAACGDESSASEGTQTIRVSVPASKDTSLVKAIDTFKEEVEEKSEGKLTVEIFPDNQLGTSREQTEQVQSGTIEMVTTDMTTLSSFIDATSVFAFPYLLPTDSDKLEELFESEVANIVDEEASKNGFKFLGFQSLGYMGITSSEKPITSPADFKGLKMRVIPSEVLTAQYKAWGANPVPVDFVEIYTALQTGIVSAQENPLEIIYSMKFHEVQKYMSLLNHSNRVSALLANKTWFDSLPADLQTIVEEASFEATKAQRELAVSEFDSYLEKISESLEVNQLAESEIEEFKKITEPIYGDLIQSDSQQKLFDAIKSFQ